MTHADEARRLWDRHRTAYVSNLEGEGWGDVDPVAEIAAALAAAKRAGIMAAAHEINLRRFSDYAVIGKRAEWQAAFDLEMAVRALLPAAVAEPAAKCATCGITHPADHSCTPAVDPQKCECRECKVCCAKPDKDGIVTHGKGCYTQSPDGGGTSYEVPCPSCGGAR